MTSPFAGDELDRWLASLPPLATLPESTALSRAHPHLFGSTEFDVRAGQDFRFSTVRFEGRVVPVMYTADTAEVAACETVFRHSYDSQTPRRPRRVFLDRYATWQWSELVTLTATRTLSLDQSTIRHLTPDAASVFTSPPTGYPRSRLFAEAVLRVLPECDAISWPSAQHSGGTSYVFFGPVSGRSGGLAREAFGGVGAATPFASRAGAEQLATIANALDITLATG